MEEVEEQPKKRDFWEKLGLVLQSSGPLLTALTVAVIGFIGSNYLKDRELRETQEREKTQIAETNTRVWVELMSKREEAESALRIHNAIVLAVADQHGALDAIRSSRQRVLRNLLASIS